MTQNPEATWAKMDTFYYQKSKTILHGREYPKQAKRKTINWEKIFVINTTEKGNISEILLIKNKISSCIKKYEQVVHIRRN